MSLLHARSLARFWPVGYWPPRASFRLRFLPAIFCCLSGFPSFALIFFVRPPCVGFFFLALVTLIRVLLVCSESAFRFSRRFSSRLCSPRLGFLLVFLYLCRAFLPWSVSLPPPLVGNFLRSLPFVETFDVSRFGFGSHFSASPVLLFLVLPSLGSRPPVVPSFFSPILRPFFVASHDSDRGLIFLILFSGSALRLLCGLSVSVSPALVTSRFFPPLFLLRFSRTCPIGPTRLFLVCVSLYLLFFSFVVPFFWPPFLPSFFPFCFHPSHCGFSWPFRLVSVPWLFLSPDLSFALLVFFVCLRSFVVLFSWLAVPWLDLRSSLALLFPLLLLS